MNTQPCIECVPNFSEGQNPEIIKRITDAIESVSGIQLLNVDPGKATNRTVVTFVGHPEKVIEAAFRAIKTAGQLIDMQQHKGEHPRMGATDVCPLIPISGISMLETVQYANRLAQRVGEELNIPVYLYEEAQANPLRKNLAHIRSGEYEGFFKKIKDPAWKPDFGPTEMDLTRGATVIGARNFLIAYNVNLNTTSTRRANAVAFDVREAGRVLREGNRPNGKVLLNADGTPQVLPGSLKHVKAIGWFIDEYQIAQISMNLTNILETPLHVVFDEVCEKARIRGLRVTGSELVGLVPLQTMLEAGRFFLKKQQRSIGVSEAELIKIAVKTLGLDELAPFNPSERIIEYNIAQKSVPRLTALSLNAFSELTASESPAPGGGSVAAYIGALGASLAAMVANLSAHKKGWDARWEFFSDWAVQAHSLQQQLCTLVDADTQAFNSIITAMQLPKASSEEQQLRKAAIEQATLEAIRVPYQVMQLSFAAFESIAAMAREGNPNSASDAGVAALAARAAIRGAWLNVKINAQGYAQHPEVMQMLVAAATIEQKSQDIETEILQCVESHIKL